MFEHGVAFDQNCFFRIILTNVTLCLILAMLAHKQFENCKMAEVLNERDRNMFKKAKQTNYYCTCK